MNENMEIIKNENVLNNVEELADENSGKGLGLIIGVGIVVVGLVAAGATYLCKKAKKKKEQKAAMNQADDQCVILEDDED